MHPQLIDAQTGYYLQQSLKSCHNKQVETYSFLFNIIVFAVFCMCVLLILYALFKGKRTPEERERMLLKDQQFVLEKIRSLKEQKANYLQNESITKISVI